MRITTSLPTIAAVAVALALTVAGCSSSTPTAANPTTSATQQVFNDADVTFVQQMFPHHAQAVDMAALVDGRTANPAVLQLAAKIKGADSSERRNTRR